jgi:uncharacterized protein (TIGR02145 family)
MQVEVLVQRIVLILLSIVLFSCVKNEVPTLSTAEVTNITGTTATSGGTITNEGSGTVVERGICWSKDITPTIEDSKTVEGGGAGAFISNMTNLDASTTYYVRAYAKNEAGIGYGMTMSFSTLGQIPSATTLSATEISTTSAVLNGVVNPNYLSTSVAFDYGKTTDYGQTITANQSPLTGNSNTPISLVITSLDPGFIYHFRIKTTNALGTTYGNDVEFTTLGQPPIAQTQQPSSVRTTIATLNGIVNANHLNTTVTFEYGTTTTYSHSIAANQNPITGNTPNNVSADLKELNVGTTYHYRVRAENSLGTALGYDITFTTSFDPVLPTVSTSAPRPTSTSSGTSGGNVTDDGGSPVTKRGVCWSTSQDPTLDDSYTENGEGTGIFTSNITGLSPNTTYYVRAYAINADGTAYGIDRTFTTDPVTVTDRDGNVYHVIRIGSQLWFKENLKTTTFSNGNSIPHVSNGSAWSTLTDPGYCWYNNNDGNKDVYGALYNWYAVETGNLCPTGWRVPSDDDCLALEKYDGNNESTIGGKLKEEGTEHWTSPNTGATDEWGFTALPGGHRTASGLYDNIRDHGHWWTSTSYSETDAWGRRLQYNEVKTFRFFVNKKTGKSIRCLRD